MNINNKLKQIRILNIIGKKLKIYFEFLNDANSFSRCYIESAQRKGDYRYNIMLLIHSLEKGMCMPNPRPFGFEKANELMKLLSNYMNTNEFEYKLGVSILYSWAEFFAEHGWTKEKGYLQVIEFLKGCPNKELDSGNKEYSYSADNINTIEFEKTIVSKHSVRDFQDKPIDLKDIELAIKCFIETPTACNRQMCRLIYIENTNVKEVLDKTIIGIPGFNKKTVQYFIVTYDLAAFAYSGERQQGLFNAGLCTMNFVNGLHAKGIGSCCLQWSNKQSEDEMVRKLLGLRDSERIGIVIGCGYYLEKNTIPCSTRRSKEEVFRIV